MRIYTFSLHYSIAYRDFPTPPVYIGYINTHLPKIGW